MMSSFIRWGALPSLLVAAALGAGCPGNTGPTDAGPDQVCADGARVCDNDRLCGGGFCDKDNDGDEVAAADDQFGCCVQLICDSNDDCEENEKCDFRRGICLPRDLCDPAADNGGRCDLDGDGTPEADCCGAGQLCEYTGGVPVCVDNPPAAADCFISLGGRVLAEAAGDPEANPGTALAGQAIQLMATATDASGKLVPHATFTWTGATDGAFTGTCAGPDVCAATVTATSGSASCDAAMTVYPTHTAGSHRVVAIDASTGAPIAGALATAYVGGALQQDTTDANGVAEFPAGAADNVSVFSDDHQWQTVMDPPEDLVVITAPIANNNDVAGLKGDFDFDAVHTVGDIKLGLAGTAIPANVTELNFANILGDIADYNVDIEGVTDPGGQVVPLPSGLVLGLGNEPIKGEYVSFGQQGRNVAWALGGQVRLAEIGEIISSVAASDDVNVGAILGAVLPFFATFDHAVVSGGALADLSLSARPCNDDGDCDGSAVCAAGHCAASGTGQPTENDEPIAYDAWPFPEQQLRPDTLLAQSAVYDMPNLPCTPGGLSGSACQAVVAEGSPYASGVILLTGVLVPGVGLVPLGLTAGLDDPDDQDSNDLRDGVLDYTGDNAPESGTALIDYAPPHDGLEGSLFVTIAIAIDIDAIADSGGGDFGASVIMDMTPKYGDTNTFSGGFLQSQGGTFTAGQAGQFAIAAKGTADFYSVNLDNGGDTEWNVWFSDANTPPFTPADFHPDPAAAAARFQHADVQAYRLGNGYGGTAPETMDDLFGFNGTNFDNMIFYMGAWSSESCKDNGVCDSTP